ncbi:GNAT family N-acetyltransferase [Paenibacillus mendelii]|uniref:Enhanced intracellular survival protein Eis n=1 Tax=Paenibacillus mendelii TaxID=206163 RepID=A0ABV6J3S0_9BACL|nr:GNAT family N-acetyltransferase [Paenibacillus mendelii]MCQ6561992.1 GNAT family N-acetyltransferase [Paenibacillus mendelii]
MEIRVLNKDDFDMRTELSMYAFQFSLTPEQLDEQRKHFKPENQWGAFEDGQLQAMYTLLPFQLYIQGRQMAMGGVAGVATFPEQRRKGHVAKLLSHALMEMKEKGQVVSCLAPFSFGFYRKYGWELYTDLKKYTILPSQFPPRVVTEGRVERVVPDSVLLERVYEAFASRYNGTLVRTQNWWKHTVFTRKAGRTAVYYRPDGEPGGYLLYGIENRVLTVHEMVYLDETARQGLWTFLANHDSMVEKLILTAPVNDELPYMLPDPRIGQEIVPYFMARIVDAASFVDQYAFHATGASVRLKLQLIDPHAPWNEGVWTWAVSVDGQGSLTKSELEDGETVDAGCDIQALTAMLMGYQRPGALRRYGRLTGSAEAADILERVVPQGQTFLMDYF